MSNARIFAWGWLIIMIALSVADWLGYGQQGLAGLAWKTLLALSMGITAVALLGDRDRRLAHPTHTNDRGESL